MQLKSLPLWLWITPIALLVIAVGRLPYGYYTFTRIVVFGFAATLAYLGWQRSTIGSLSSAIFGLISVLFNPFVEIHLLRDLWQRIDCTVAAIFAAHLAFVLLWRVRAAAKGDTHE
jgi:hypothetical protein